MKTFRFDIFCGDRFYTTMYLRYPYNWVFTETQLIDEVYERYPLLKRTSWHFA